MNHQPLTVSDLTNSIKQLIETNFAFVSVQGEISNIIHASSGHLYLNLKDHQSQIRAVIFRYVNQQLKFHLENGLEIIIFGQLSLYEKRGEYQLIIQRVEPVGTGALQLAFEQLKKRLAAEGLFDDLHKKKIPYIPQKIGIITSSSGAALYDILNVLQRRFPSIPVIINPVQVQGDSAAKQIADAIQSMETLPEVDVMILGRGGGSLEDLWAFNEEIVARAIYNCSVPIVSAVGHEIDFTIADFVADLRAPTPSAAAELIVPDRENLISMVQQYQNQIQQTIKYKVKSHKELLQYRTEQIKKLMQDFLLRKQNQLEQISLALKALNPLSFFEKGYSIVYNSKYQPVQNLDQIQSGETLTIKVKDGEIITKVLGINPTKQHPQK